MKTKLVWHTEKRRVKDIAPYSKNPNINTDKQFRDLKKNIDRVGYVEIIVVDVDGTIVAGAHRWQALMEMGKAEEEIDVRVPSRKLTKEEFDRYLIASNALRGEWNFEALKSFDIELLADIGLDVGEISDIWAENLEAEDDDFDEEKELAKIEEPTTKLGDIIILGEHRLICGDSTDPTVLKKLFGKEKASMIYSDPVYNLKGGVSYSSGVGGKSNYGGSVNDTRTDGEYEEFLRRSMKNALSVAKDDVHVFYWSDQAYIWLIQTLYRELGILNRRVCLWLKNGQNPTPGVAFSKAYEPCTYGTIGKPFISNNLQNANEVMNGKMTTGNDLHEEVSDLWLTKRLAGKDHTHATSKPPKLHEKAIRRCTRPGDIILDSFSGSASTMVAAEQLKRRVYAVELEPVFCDLAIKRYERLTKKKAKIIHDHEKE